MNYPLASRTVRLIASFLAGVSAIVSFCPLIASEEGFTDLLSGDDLSAWEIVVDKDSKVDGKELFKLEDGVLRVYPTAEDGSDQPFGAIFTTQEFEDYHFTLEYRWGEKKYAPRYNAVRDAGIIFHVIGDAKIWPTGIECQIQEGDTGDIWIIGQTRVSSYVHPIVANFDRSGDLETRGAGMYPQRFARSFSWEKEGWNRVDVIVEGDNAVFKVNGQVVNEAANMRYRTDSNNDWTWYSLTKGRICLQAEGAELFYRNVRIRMLDAD